MKKLTVLFIMFIFLLSCKTQKEITNTSENYQSDYIREDILNRVLLPKDSARLRAIFRCDSLNRILLIELTESKTKGFESIFNFRNGILDYNLNIGGDTVYIPSTNVYYKINSNTLKTITIRETTKVLRELNIFQKFQIWLGKIFIWIIVLTVLYFLGKYILHFVLRKFGY